MLYHEKTRMTADKHRDAVSRCLSGCYAAYNPLAALAEYISALRADPDWTEEEVDLVEINSLRILKPILSRQEPS